MKAKSILTTAAILAAALFILDVPAANAAVNYWQASRGDSGNWTDTAHWSLGHVPTASEPVDFPALSGAYIVTMNANEGAGSNEGYAQTLTMHANCTLNIPTGKVLEIGSADSQTSTINGDIHLQASGSTLRFMYSHTLAGAGTLDGQDNGAKIEIADSEMLTSTTTIEGNCQILPVPDATNTTFLNSGTVHANNPGTLDLAVYSLGSPGGNWQVSTSASAILEFSVGSTTMTGRFDVDAGKVTVEDNVDTNGVLDFQGGTIDVASGAYFKASQP